MQVPHPIRELYTHGGPFATVYLDATRSTESGQREVELRLRAAREKLRNAGADQATIDALGAAAGNGEPGPHGQVLIGADGELLASLVMPRPPLRPSARWAPLPHAMPYLAQLGPQIAHVVVLADRTGADIVTIDAAAAAHTSPPERDSVRGPATYPIHKTSTIDWSERHFQQRVDNSWATNARDVALKARDHAERIGAELVIIAGDERARGLLRKDLGALLPPATEVDDVSAGGRAPGSSAEALDEGIHDALQRRVWRRRRDVFSRLQEGSHGKGFAVTGIPQVVTALRRAQVDTVVLSDDPSSTARAWIGPKPLDLASSPDELHDLGVEEPVSDRLDAALVRAIVGSDAGLLITPNAHDYVQDGIGALLRYSDMSTPQT